MIRIGMIIKCGDNREKDGIEDASSRSISLDNGFSPLEHII